MSDSDHQTTDYSKYKVNDLKKILKTRGLPLTGNKQELVERLQSNEAAAEALLEESEVVDDIDEELDRELDETALDETPPKPDSNTKEQAKADKKNEKSVGNEDAKKSEEHKVNLKNVKLSDEARKKARAERFGATSTKDNVLAKRAERFSETKMADSTTTVTTTGQQPQGTVTVALKRRAERFGLQTPVDIKRQHLEKLQARKLRFQSSVVTSSTELKATETLKAVVKSNKPDVSAEERKRLRAQRFKITI